MKRALITLILVLATLTVLLGQEATGVKGKWDMTIETPQGPTPLTLTVAAVEGEKITGTLGSQRGDLEVAGKLSGAEISFTGTFSGNGQSITITFTGKVEGDAMSGAVDFGGMGSGSWSAKRAK